MRSKCTNKVRIGTLSVAAIALAGCFVFQLNKESLRTYNEGRTYAKNYLDSIPDNAIVSTFSDNASHVVGYEHFANNLKPSIYFTFGSPQNVFYLQQKDGWTLEIKRAFLKDFIFRASLNPLCLTRVLSEDEIKNRPLFTEYTASDEGDITPYALPHGFLIQILERKTSDQEVLDADSKFRSKHPELFQKAPKNPNRLSREAFGYAHLRRGLFFVKRKLWRKAIEEIEIAKTWMPENPQVLFPYGAALEEIKDYHGAELAYLDCIDFMPEFTSARQNLALLYLYAGREDLAMKYAKEELVLTRGAKNTVQLIALLEKRIVKK